MKGKAGKDEKSVAVSGVAVGMTRRVALGWGAAGLTGSMAAALPVRGRNHDHPCYSAAFGDGWLSIYALSACTFRVRFAPKQGLTASPILLSGKTVPLRRRSDTKETVTLRLPQISCTVNKNDGSLAFFDRTGTPVLKELAGARQLTASKVQDVDTTIAAQGFVSPPDERLYGTGQFQDGFLNLRGLSRRLTQVNTQISLPFLLSSKGYGLLWHNTGLTDLNPLTVSVTPARVPVDAKSSTVSVTTTAGNAETTRNLAAFACDLTIETAGRYAFQLDVGQPMATRHHIEIDGQRLVEVASLWLPPTTSFFADLAAGSHKLRIVGDSKDSPTLRFGPVQDTTVLRSPVSEGVDYVVIAGPAAEDIIAEYRRLTGVAPMMPKWAYGYIHCRERYHSSYEILANAQEFRNRKIPLDVIVQDWQYWGRYGWNAMRFDETDYPDPAAMIARLHSQNVRFMLSVWSKADLKSDVGKSFTSRNCFIPGTTWIDFFNRRAGDVYWGAMSYRLLSLGVDAWWQDATEPENDDLVGRITAAGPGEIVRLQYPLEVTRTVYEGQRRDAPDRRVMILTRSAFLGEQRFAAATWSGDIGCDWDTLKRQIPAGLNMMAAGHPYWTVDAGGFFRPGNSQYTDPAYHELLIRWLQYAAFLPLMRVHGYQTTTEPWHYGADVERRSREIIELRYRMLPYIYSAASEITRKGSSMMRPLVMDFAHDPKALDQAHSFMFGRSFHVAPVLQPGVSSWNVYLPQTPGGWYDFWTNEHRSGGAEHDISVPLDRIPLHVKAGAIVPLGPVVQSTAEADDREIAVTVYAGADGTFEFYEDEGINYGYEKGRFSTIAFIWHDTARQLTISSRKGRFPGMLQHRNFAISLVGRDGTQSKVSARYEGKRLDLAL